ncbi:hypothetical protein OAU99_01580 [Candidatus Poseidoniaceae archaeon]|nr:hypothetical protein [Candidatus Poseidoniaceae archaeon]
MSDSDAISDFEITHISNQSTDHDFFRFSFNINSRDSLITNNSVTIRFTANNNCTGILFVPCKYYEELAVAHQKTKAVKVCKKDGDYTSANAIIPTNLISTQDEETHLIFENLPNGVLQAEICSIVVGLRNNIKVEYKSNDSNWKHIDCDPVKETKNPVQERFEWITNFVTNFTHGQSASSYQFPQFHPKQQATINALQKRDEFNTGNSGLVTYVGTDDTANFLTAISQIVNESNSEIECKFRHDSDHDKSTHTEFVGKWAKKLGVKLLDHSNHSEVSAWAESDVIVDTYTLMSWPDKTLEGTLSQIRTRINHLSKGGCLVLVFPTDVNVERFTTSDQLPDLFKKNLDEIKTTILNAHDEENLEINMHTLGNTAWMLVSKAKPQSDGFLQPASSDDAIYVNNPETANNTGWDINSQPEIYEPIVGQGTEPTKTPAISEQFISELTQAQNWIGFQNAVHSKGQREPMLRPVELPIVEEIRNHLRGKILKQGYGKYVVIQAHPGWGKTSNLGEALFPEDQTKVDFLEDYSIWVGTLEEVKSWVSKARDFEKSIVIIDDIHKYRESISNDDLHKQAMDIASKVSALFVTCQIDPMDGEIYDVNPEVSDHGSCHIIDVGFFPNLDDDSESLPAQFVNHLLLKTDCIKLNKPDNQAAEATEICLDDQTTVALGIWGPAINERLFSDKNLESFGKYYSPRDAIKHLKNARRKFTRCLDPHRKLESGYYSEIFDKDSGKSKRFGLGGDSDA